MTNLRKAAEMALERLESHEYWMDEEAIQALRQALAQPEQEPVAWGMQRKDGVIIDVICPEEHAKEPGDYTIPLYTAPPKREWVGLTEEEFSELLYFDGRLDAIEVPLIADLVRAVQAKLKEKNGA